MPSLSSNSRALPATELAARAGVFVTHEGAGEPIHLVGWRDGERRSLPVNEARALGLIQQLAVAAMKETHLRIWHDDGKHLGSVAPLHALTLIIDLSKAVRANRAAAARGQ